MGAFFVALFWGALILTQRIDRIVTLLLSTMVSGLSLCAFCHWRETSPRTVHYSPYILAICRYQFTVARWGEMRFMPALALIDRSTTGDIAPNRTTLLLACFHQCVNRFERAFCAY